MYKLRIILNKIIDKITTRPGIISDGIITRTISEIMSRTMDKTIILITRIIIINKF